MKIYISMTETEMNFLTNILESEKYTDFKTVTEGNFGTIRTESDSNEILIDLNESFIIDTVSTVKTIISGIIGPLKLYAKMWLNNYKEQLFHKGEEVVIVETKYQSKTGEVLSRTNELVPLKYIDKDCIINSNRKIYKTIIVDDKDAE